MTKQAKCQNATFEAAIEDLVHLNVLIYMTIKYEVFLILN